MLDKDSLCSRSLFFIAHTLCPSLAGGHFHEALLPISWLTLVFTSAQHPGCAGWLQPALKACDIEHNRDQIQLRSANQQQTWALPVTISASLLCQGLWKRRRWTMKELRRLLMWDCQSQPTLELRERGWIYQHSQFWCHLAHSTEDTKAYYRFTIRRG